jgi:hypothetical protein
MSPSPFDTKNTPLTVRPPQFSLRTLLVAAAGIGLTFGVLRWFDVSPAVGFFVLAVLIVAALATAGLMLSLLQAYGAAGSTDGDRAKDDEPNDGIDPPADT